MRVLTYPKINLTLDVLDRRPDGYHNISSVMQTIGPLCDELTIELTDQPKSIALTVLDPHGRPHPSLAADESNLVHRAAIALIDATGSKIGASLSLVKRIPTQAGLGGGSSNAAATLRAMNERLGLPLSLPELVLLAATLGADVPFFIHGGTCLVEGIGERVTPLDPAPRFSGILVKPPVGVSTPEAYRALDEMRGLSVKTQPLPWNGSLDSIHNDFEPVVFPRYPAIDAARQALLQAGCTRTLLCGSGSSVIGLFETGPAEETLRTVREAGVGEAMIVTLLSAAGAYDR